MKIGNVGSKIVGVGLTIGGAELKIVSVGLTIGDVGSKSDV